jgi:hypothetical protein
MTRRYDEPVEVRRRDEDPAEFLWRGRLYVVRAVLETWVETGAWWRTAVRAAPGDPAGPRAGSLRGGEIPATDGSSALSVAPAVDMALDTAVDVAPNPTAGRGERQVWRVEASAGRARGTGVFDLCFDWDAPDRPWVLLRAMD